MIGGSVRLLVLLLLFLQRVYFGLWDSEEGSCHDFEISEGLGHVAEFLSLWFTPIRHFRPVELQPSPKLDDALKR